MFSPTIRILPVFSLIFASITAAASPLSGDCTADNLDSCEPNYVLVTIRGFEVEEVGLPEVDGAFETTTFIGSISSPVTDLQIRYGSDAPDVLVGEFPGMELVPWSPYRDALFQAASSPYFTTKVRHPRTHQNETEEAVTRALAAVPVYTISCQGDSVRDGIDVGLNWGSVPTRGLNVYWSGCGRVLERMDVEVASVGDDAVQLVFSRKPELLEDKNPEAETALKCRGSMNSRGRVFSCRPK
jgi:hypothetical protein